jgi:hypothetical protein
MIKIYDDSGLTLSTERLEATLPLIIDFGSAEVLAATDLSESIVTVASSVGSIFILIQLLVGGSLQMLWTLVNLV